jgi:hypothetical protein
MAFKKNFHEKIYRKLLMVIFLCFFMATAAFADPLVITTSLSATALVNNLMGGGVTYSNPVYTGSVLANGTFTGGTGVIGFESGIILSTGLATTAVGPNTSDSASTIFNTAGDAGLSALGGGVTTYDAATLEFDFVPSANMLSFSFVFASEEYNEFVGQSYNDIFAIFLDGTNIAIVPSTTTPIAINNVNNCVNSAYYINNSVFGGSVFCPSTGIPSANLNTQFDGLTTVITLNLPITPGIQHHLKIAIADASDAQYDSAVFIKSSSFNSGTNTVTPTITPTWTPSNTWTITPTQTQTYTSTMTYTITPTLSITPTFTFTLTATVTPTMSCTDTPSFTATATPTITFTLTATRTFTFSFTPTITPSLTATWTSTITSTPTFTATPSFTPTATSTPYPFCLELKGNFPNPFSDYGTHIVYRLCRPGPVTCKIFTVSGEVVRVLKQDGIRGYNSLFWDGQNRASNDVASGVFIYHLEAESEGEKAQLWGKCAVVR